MLLRKRIQKTRDERGKWDTGGGGLEFGEAVEAALFREIREEYGAEPLNHEFLGFRDVHREHEGLKTHWIALDHLVHIDPTQVICGEPDMIDDIQWFDLKNIPPDEELHSQLPNALRLYRDRLNALC